MEDEPLPLGWVIAVRLFFGGLFAMPGLLLIGTTLGVIDVIPWVPEDPSWVQRWVLILAGLPFVSMGAMIASGLKDFSEEDTSVGQGVKHVLLLDLLHKCSRRRTRGALSPAARTPPRARNFVDFCKRSIKLSDTLGVFTFIIISLERSDDDNTNLRSVYFVFRCWPHHWYVAEKHIHSVRFELVLVAVRVWFGLLCISGMDRSRVFRKLGHDKLYLSRLALCRIYSCFDSHSVIFHAEMERQAGKTTSIELACTAHIFSSTNYCWFHVSLNNHQRRLRAIKSGPTINSNVKVRM